MVKVTILFKDGDAEIHEFETISEARHFMRDVRELVLREFSLDVQISYA